MTQGWILWDNMEATIMMTWVLSALVASRHPKHPPIIMNRAPHDALIAIGKKPKAVVKTMANMMPRAKGAFFV